MCFGHRITAKVHFHRTVTLANLPEKCVRVQDRTVCFVKKFSHHPIWQGFQELHVASDFVPTMFSFHVTFDLHGIDRWNAMVSAILLYWPKNFLGPDPVFRKICHGIGNITHEHWATQHGQAGAGNPQPSLRRGVELNSPSQGGWRQVCNCPFLGSS